MEQRCFHVTSIFVSIINVVVKHRTQNDRWFKKRDNLRTNFYLLGTKVKMIETQPSTLIIWKTMHLKTKKNKKYLYTSFANCCRISIISEKSGLNVGSCCQDLSRSSTNFGWVFLGMVGRKPWNPFTVTVTKNHYLFNTHFHLIM